MNDIVRVRLPARPESVADARHAVEDVAEELPLESVEDVSLMVSELVTNSVRHAGAGGQGPIELALHVKGKNVRVEVSDGGRGFDVPAFEAKADRAGGWGLFLIDHLSDRWGLVPRSAGGKTVWFEVGRR